MREVRLGPAPPEGLPLATLQIGALFYYTNGRARKGLLCQVLERCWRGRIRCEVVDPDAPAYLRPFYERGCHEVCPPRLLIH